MKMKKKRLNGESWVRIIKESVGTDKEAGGLLRSTDTLEAEISEKSAVMGK